MTPEQVARHRQRIGADDCMAEAGQPAERAVEPVRGPRVIGRNRWEQAYAAVLDLRHKAGEFREWGYERIKFRLPGDVFYTPDYDILRWDGFVEIHELKGMARRAGMDKLRAAIELYGGFHWYLVRGENVPIRMLSPKDVPSR
ncbi:MAG: hypothetical protein IPM07_25375 [Anaerolineales bacterium]|nr:hypothetical protein [Anaerolineales bacterium]